MNGKALISSLLILGSVALLTASLTMTGAAESKKTDKALERTRKTVRMLDDIYKTTMDTLGVECAPPTSPAAPCAPPAE